MIKLLLDKQIFASSDAITAATRKILSTTCAILALTWFCHLSMCLWSLGGLEEPQGGTPPYTWKKFQCLKLIFRPFGTKKNFESGKWPPLTPPPIMEFPIIFLIFFLTLPLFWSEPHISFRFPKENGYKMRSCTPLNEIHRYIGNCEVLIKHFDIWLGLIIRI